ncbi:WhiB family transcriptional regulator [Streptomyces xanthochromogenes]|uniref:WhiB family transcriptional regulator n=1 Tax=Streptomyces xanthochromogenes TaxID=67384 RepID=UPI002F40F9A1
MMVLLGWSERAVCKESDADALFAETARQQEAVALCGACPVRTQCLAHALDQRIEFGVWGGMTERERRALLRRRPRVSSWSDLLESARTEYGKDPVLAPAIGSAPTARSALRATRPASKAA